jgi:hypothetical protein
MIARQVIAQALLEFLSGLLWSQWLVVVGCHVRSPCADLFRLRSAHPPDIILEYPPAGHRIVDEWHYAETRCAPSAPRTAEFSHRRHAGFPTVIAKTRAGSVMVHVTTTLRLAPTHSFLESSPTKVSQPAHREFREFFTETTST